MDGFKNKTKFQDESEDESSIAETSPVDPVSEITDGIYFITIMFYNTSGKFEGIKSY